MRNFSFIDKKIRVFSLIIFLLVSLSCKNKIDIPSHTFYVSNSGNDNNDGTIENPWKTIQKSANSIVAGDTVLIKAGTYNERVEIQVSGTENKYIVFKNYKNDNVTIDGTNINWEGNWNGLFNISEQNFIVVEGLKVANVNNHAGFFIEDASNIILKNNKTYNTYSSGIGVWNSSNIFLENNEVELACNGGQQESISLSNSNNCEISKNNVHNNGNGENGGEGIDVKQGSYNVSVYKNWVHNINNRVGIYPRNKFRN